MAPPVHLSQRGNALRVRHCTALACVIWWPNSDISFVAHNRGESQPKRDAVGTRCVSDGMPPVSAVRFTLILSTECRRVREVRLLSDWANTSTESV